MHSNAAQGQKAEAAEMAVSCRESLSPQAEEGSRSIQCCLMAVQVYSSHREDHYCSAALSSEEDGMDHKAANAWDSKGAEAL